MTRIRNLTPEQDAEVQRMSLAGESILKLAARFNVGKKSITNALKRVGGGNRNKGRLAFTEDVANELRRRNEAGETILQIADSVGVDRVTVGKAIRSVGGKPKYGPRRGERIVDAMGYAKVLVDAEDELGWSMTQKRQKSLRSGAYVLEHRLVLARKIGRALLPHETVHHVNGDRLDNQPENLELRVGRHGKGATAAHCGTCTCFAGVEQPKRAKKRRT